MSYNTYLHWKTTPITDEPYVSVVIPAYNEELRIVPTIGAIASYMSQQDITWELIIADDGSSDQTIELLTNLEMANLVLLHAPTNQGKGRAVQRGMLAARGRYVLFDDADNSTPIEELQNLLPFLESQSYDVAVGSRAIHGAEETHRTLLRRTLSNGLRFIVHHGFSIGVRDTQCGFKLFTREAAQRLYKAQTIAGFSFDLEILYLAAKLGYRIAEVPVTWVDAPGSKVDTSKEIQRFLRDLLTIKVNDLRGVYMRA